jgi:hypothetical protein
MAEIRRNRFAFLVNSLFEEFERIRKDHKLPIPEYIKQPDYLGFDQAADIKTPHKINPDNCTLSHVVYITLTNKQYDFSAHGFPEVIINNRLQFQSGPLRKAIGKFANGEEVIFLSKKYYNAYLSFLGWKPEDLETKFLRSGIQIPELNIRWETKTHKQRGSRASSGNVLFEHDIFLASPKLTLGRKINIDFADFRNTLSEALGDKYNDEIEKVLIHHFFGFVPKDLNKEYELFEKYMTDLKVQLDKKGFNVYDSRADKTMSDIYGIGHPPTQLKKDLSAIDRSRTYILVSPYPRLFSSAWVEAGVAISKGKPCKFICSDRMRDLPYILQDRSGTHVFDVVEYRGMATESIKKRIKFTIKVITEWSPFRCEDCHEKDGRAGRIGKEICTSCNGKGYFTLSETQH